jgi:hypothetical protein
MPYADVNGTRLCYESAGAGDPLILIHRSKARWPRRSRIRVLRGLLDRTRPDAMPEVGHGFA